MIKILLIEDDLDDIELLEEALRSKKVLYNIDIVVDGMKAVEYIRNCKSCPDIVILDFNLPKIHGREVILEIKSVASFKNIPLLILTTSSAKEDIEYSYKNGASRYLIKPTTVEGINEIVDTVVELASSAAN
jgi:CheY-like chemotaxis protein